MAKKRTGPRRAIDSAVSLDFAYFSRELVRALKLEGEEIATRFQEGKPFEDWEHPDRCDSAGRFSSTYLLGMMLSKFDDGKPSPDKEQKTWNRFHEAEESCRITNEAFRNNVWPASTQTTVYSVIHTAKHKITKLLGDFCWNEAADGFSWGPGATTRLPRRKADATYKYSGNPESTIDNLALAQAVVRSVPLWLESLSSEGGAIQVVGGNKVITVPKNYKTDRTIAIEPDLNMYVQKGIGLMIRRRLQRVGVDLNSQRENQEMARLGSIFGNLATVDLSMASDTVSYEIVKALLPSDWLLALEQCRSLVGVLPSGSVVCYEKFSSMGNGYTFELESLIFWAILQSVVELYELKDHRIAVYGDDLIISVDGTNILRETLEAVGFRFNVEKSHVAGPFRESCGKHYFNGFDVTPFFYREVAKTSRDVFLLHNNLYRWCVRNEWNDHWDRQLMKQLIHWLRRIVPSNWRRPRIPDGFGDGAFIGTFDEARPIVAPNGFEGFRAEIMVDVSRSHESELVGRFLKSLASLEHVTDHLSHLAKNRVSKPGGKSVGGVSLPPLVRIRKVLIPQFVLMDPFTVR